MKKIFIWALVIVMVLSMAGCAKKEKREALIKYVDVDTAELDILCGEMLDSFNSVVSDNQFNNAVTYKEFKDVTKAKAEATLVEAKEVAELIEDEDIAEVHGLFIDYLETFIEVIDMAMKGIEESSNDQINRVNARLDEVNEMRMEYHNRLKELGEECGVEITYTVVD